MSRPHDELASIERNITDTEQELAAARQELDAAAGRLILEGDAESIGTARAQVAALRDRLDELYGREAVLRHRIGEESEITYPATENP